MILIAESVLCCAECEKPLATTPNGGAYCTHCKYPPSMQDTFIIFRCPPCGETLKGAGNGLLRCPKCGTDYKKP